MTELTNNEADQVTKDIEAEIAKISNSAEREPEKEQEAQEQKSELTEFEQKQKERGWNPDGPKSAEEWARSEPLYDELKHRGKEIKQLKKTVDSMKAILEKQEQQAYQRALAELKYERDLAIQKGDIQLVNQLEQQATSMSAPAPQQPEIIPEVEDFRERHAEWLEGTSYGEIKMQKYAQQRDAELMSRGLSPERHMSLLEEDIKAKFPDYFGSKKSNTQAVESAASSGVAGSRSKQKFTRKDLSHEQLECLRNFEKYKTFTESEYIDLLVKQGDLK